MHLLANRLSFFFGIKIHLRIFFLPRSSRKNAHSSLRYFGIRGIEDTSFVLPNCRFAPETTETPKTVSRCMVAILGVFFRYEQWNAIQLSVVLFLSADNRCTNSCTAADKQQGNPQSKVACIAGLRRYPPQKNFFFFCSWYRPLQLRRYGVGFFDFLCTVLFSRCNIYRSLRSTSTRYCPRWV